jgi:hypothetical protein
MYVNEAGKLDQAGLSGFWLTTAGIGLLATLLFALFFRDETTDPVKENA